VSDLSKATRAFLVTGDDEATIETETQRLLARVAGPAPDAFSLDVVRDRSGASATDLLREVIRSLKAPPFMGGHKTVWLQNFSLFGSEGTARSKGPEAQAFRELADLIEADLSHDVYLLMNGPGADPKKRLATVCAAKGGLVLCPRPSIRSREWQQQMRALLERNASDKGLALPRDVADFLVDAIGTDTGRIEGELEKLICYIGGPDKPVTRHDAEQICISQGEEISWALSDALGKRDAAEALRVVGVLLQSQRDAAQGARSLLAQTARYYRELLQAKVFMASRRLSNPRSVQNELRDLSPEDRDRYVEDGITIVGTNAYRVRLLAEQAAIYQGAELIEAVRALRDAYLKCITSSVSERVALEEVIIRVTALPPRGDGARRRR